MPRFGLFLTAVLMLAGAPAWACEACGAFRAGDTVKAPANIVIFRDTASSPDVFYNDTKIAAKLGKAGHHVTRLQPGGKAANGTEVDIVLARVEELDRARAALAAQCPDAVFLPVYEGFGQSESGSEPQLAENSPLRHILGVLTLTMQKLAAN